MDFVTFEPFIPSLLEPWSLRLAEKPLRKRARLPSLNAWETRRAPVGFGQEFAEHMDQIR